MTPALGTDRKGSTLWPKPETTVDCSSLVKIAALSERRSGSNGERTGIQRRGRFRGFSFPERMRASAKVANGVFARVFNSDGVGEMRKRIDADYPEDLVGIAIESFLTQLSFPRRRFSVEPVSRSRERWLGADARLHSAIRGFRPFYMQFKKPTAYPHDSTSKIIADRRKAGLGTSPRALYFELREKKPNHHDFQHNVLFRLRNRLVNRGLGDAAYVCPLFVDRSAYRNNLHWSGLARWPRFWRHTPWDLEELLLEDGGRTFRFDRIPLLAEHITVPPHVVVTTAKHKYSFNEIGSELCFHSPEALPDGSADLASFLARVGNGFLEEGEKLSPRQSTETLNELIEAVYGDGDPRPEFEIDPLDPMGAWFHWGDHLRKQHAIEQFALMHWSDDVRLPL